MARLVREAHPDGSKQADDGHVGCFRQGITRHRMDLANIINKAGAPEEKTRHWYAAYTHPNREFAVKARLDKLEVENFLPTEELVRETPFGRKKARVALIHGMIFIRTDKATSFALINDHGLRIIYLKDIEGHHSLIIPDKQMEDFMFLLDVSANGVEVLNKDLRPGDRVRVVKGPLAGLEGELMRVRGHKRVVIRLQGVASIATSYIPGSWLERLDGKSGK